MRGETVVQDRAASAPCGFRLPMRPVHGVQQAERLGGAFAQIGPVGLERREAADVHVPQIHAGRAVQHPVGDHAAGAAGRLDTDGIEAGRDEQAGQFRRFAEDVAHVGRKAFRAVEQQLDAGVLQGRDAAYRGVEQRLEMPKILGQLVKTEILGDAVHAPGLCSRLETADQQLAGVLLHVDAVVGIAQHRQVARQSGDRLGDEIKMLGGVQRHDDALGGGEVAAPHAGRQHDVARLDIAARGGHAGGPAAVAAQAGDLDALDNPRAVRAGGRGQGLRGADRIGLAVGG